MMHDWKGAEAIEGTYPFTIERSVKGFASITSCTR